MGAAEEQLQMCIRDRLFESLGVELKVERGRRVFPVSDKAEEIRQALLRYAEGADIVRDGAKKLLLEPLAQPEEAPAAPENPRHPKKKKPGPACRCAVSYTHLDVYKRQVSYCLASTSSPPSVRGSGCGTPFCTGRQTAAFRARMPMRPTPCSFPGRRAKPRQLSLIHI